MTNLLAFLITTGFWYILLRTFAGVAPTVFQAFLVKIGLAQKPPTT